MIGNCKKSCYHNCTITVSEKTTMFAKMPENELGILNIIKFSLLKFYYFDYLLILLMDFQGEVINCFFKLIKLNLEGEKKFI